MKRPIDGFLTALTTLCRVPLRVRFEPDYPGMGAYLAAVGLPAALLVLAVLSAARLAGADPFLAALAALSAQYFAFNLFHLDGLLDSADALLGQGSREERLRILRDPRLGSFAFFAGFVVLAAKLHLLGAQSVFWLYPVAGRAAAALVPCALEPARAEGLGAALAGYKRGAALAGSAAALAVSVGIAAGAAYFSGQAAGPAAVRAAVWLACGVLAGFLPAVLAFGRGLGGFSGDALGLAVELGELGCLAAAASIVFD